MNIKFNSFYLEGDFLLVDIKELGFDRDFIIDPKTSVININIYKTIIQYTNICRIIFRASSKSNLITIHFLSDKDLYSTISNIELDLNKVKLEYENKDFKVTLKILER